MIDISLQDVSVPAHSVGQPFSFLGLSYLLREKIAVHLTLLDRLLIMGCLPFVLHISITLFTLLAFSVG